MSLLSGFVVSLFCFQIQLGHGTSGTALHIDFKTARSQLFLQKSHLECPCVYLQQLMCALDKQPKDGFWSMG